jgi:superfamily I DNA and/or RNA helicase
VVRIVEALIQAGLSPAQIGITTPYKAQVGLLHHQLTQRILEGLEVDSVDAFQGREKSVMIFDTVRSNSEGQVGFLSDKRRVNVAMTRAQHQLIVLGDSATLSHDPLWSSFFDHAMARGAYRSVFELTSLQEFT